MAIAFVAAADLGNNGGSGATYTASYTVGSGSNRLLVVGVEGDLIAGDTSDPISVTYAGVNMTFIAHDITVIRGIYLYYLLNPASGANNVVITFGGSHFILGTAADYTGVKQSAQPDASATATKGVDSNSFLTGTITTVADNCWAANFVGLQGPSGPATAGAGETRRAFDGTFATYAYFDSNGAVTPAGSYSMTTNESSATEMHLIMASFSPAASGFQAAWARGSNLPVIGTGDY